MHQIGYYALAVVGGTVLGYAFRGKENELIRETVNDAMAAWMKAQQQAQKIAQDLQGGAMGVIKKL